MANCQCNLTVGDEGPKQLMTNIAHQIRANTTVGEVAVSIVPIQDEAVKVSNV